MSATEVCDGDGGRGALCAHSGMLGLQLRLACQTQGWPPTMMPEKRIHETSKSLSGNVASSWSDSLSSGPESFKFKSTLSCRLDLSRPGSLWAVPVHFQVQ